MLQSEFEIKEMGWRVEALRNKREIGNDPQSGSWGEIMRFSTCRIFSAGD